MSTRIESLGIDRLSVKERLELIDEICDTLPDEIDPAEVPEWHFAELAKRRARMDAEPGKGTPWREILDRLEARS